LQCRAAVIRSGDYYMFDDISDDELDVQTETSDELQDEIQEEEDQKKPGPFEVWITVMCYECSVHATHTLDRYYVIKNYPIPIANRFSYFEICNNI